MSVAELVEGHDDAALLLGQVQDEQVVVREDQFAAGISSGLKQ